MLHLLVALLLVSGAWAQCNCSYLTQPPPEHDANNWPTFYIQNPTTPDYTPCNGSCKYFLNSGNPNKGIGNYHIFKWDEDGGKNSLSVYDCDANGVESNILLFNATYNNPTDKSFQSTGQYVCVEISVVKPGTIIVGMNRTSLGTTAAPRKTTKPPVPTTPYNGRYTKNPSLISLDVMFMVDGGSNKGSNSTPFDQSKILAAAIVNAFDPNTVFAQNASVAPAWGSRMTLRFLTSVNDKFIGAPWNQDTTFISSQISNLFQVNTPTLYYNCLVDLLDPKQSVFSVNSSAPEQSSRPTAERMLIIVASSVPNDLDAIANSTMQDKFTALDVHPVLIAYGMQNNDVSKIKAKLAPFWGVTSVPTIDNLNDSVISFFDNYLLDATNVCNVNTTIEMPSNTTQSVLHPSPNYRSAKDSWDEDHQTGRYCNFQHLSYRFQVGADEVQQFNVTYELEPGKDILNFYQDDGTEIVSLSGADVGPSTFSTMGPVTAEFTSNESQVFGGFNITYKIITSSGPTNV